MYKILVVDDSEMARNEVVNLLRQDGMEVFIATNGREGLEIIQSQSDISLVISDINMPIMDGLTMLEEIRKVASGKKIPAIIVSSDANTESKDRGKNAGVVAWVLKPINAKSFIAGIKAILSRGVK